MIAPRYLELQDSKKTCRLNLLPGFTEVRAYCWGLGTLARGRTRRHLYREEFRYQHLNGTRHSRRTKGLVKLFLLSTKALPRLLGSTASQIRQDLSWVRACCWDIQTLNLTWGPSLVVEGYFAKSQAPASAFKGCGPDMDACDQPRALSLERRYTMICSMASRPLRWQDI